MSIERLKNHMIATKGLLSGKELRDHQVEALEFINSSTKRFIGINAPTGAGKSQIGIEGVSDGPCFFLCTSKQLQAQILQDFPDIKLLKGRGNYPCPTFTHCGNCYRIKKCGDCKYRAAKREALQSIRSTLNFAYFLTSCNYVNFLAKDKLSPRSIIIDEADELDTTLTNFISFEFTRDHLAQLGINMDMPMHKTVISEIHPWIADLQSLVVAEIQDTGYMVDGIIKEVERGAKLDYDDQKVLNKHQRLQRLTKKLSFLLTQDFTADTWVYYYDDKKSQVTLKPLWLNRKLTDEFLFNHGQRFLFMSATLPSKPVLCQTMGIDESEMDYFECGSSFPIESRKVYISPKYTLGRKYEINENAIKFAVKDVLDLHQNERGIIHCVSFKLAQIISRLSPRLIFHNGEDKNAKYTKFINSPDSVFVSPSSIRGLDLKDDLARFIIFLKVPYPDLSDIMTKSRTYSRHGDIWYASQTIQSIVQGAGRGMRHEDDHCTTYILDGQMVRLLKQRSGLFPQWFKEAIWFD
jgi:ATP-dependent DNA helicase DinG